MKKSLSSKQIEKNCRRELRLYQKYFRESRTNAYLGSIWPAECQRAIYVLRSVLDINWDEEKDEYLGYSAYKELSK
jgi:hypothetical protein